MPAAVWLQPTGDQQQMLRSLIAALARRNGTAAFEPHLTVCSARDLNPAKIEAAAGYVRRSRLLPLAVRKTGISYSTTTPFRAVVIECRGSVPPRESSDQAPQHLLLITGGLQPNRGGHPATRQIPSLRAMLFHVWRPVRCVFGARYDRSKRWGQIGWRSAPRILLSSAGHRSFAAFTHLSSLYRPATDPTKKSRNNLS